MFKKKQEPKKTANKPIKEPWGEYKLNYELDYVTANYEYRLYQYCIFHIYIYTGVTGYWKELARGNKTWANKIAKELKLKVPAPTVNGEVADE